MQKFWKSVKIWQSYREFEGGTFFLRHSVHTLYPSTAMSVEHWVSVMRRLNKLLTLFWNSNNLDNDSISEIKRLLWVSTFWRKTERLGLIFCLSGLLLYALYTLFNCSVAARTMILLSWYFGCISVAVCGACLVISVLVLMSYNYWTLNGTYVAVCVCNRTIRC